MTTAIVSILESSTSGPIVTSEAIAYGVGGQHRAVLQLIRTYREDLAEFGTLEFEMRAFTDIAGRSQQREVFLLNEHQATLIMTYMRNMPRIREFKKALVTAFYQMRSLVESPIVQEALFGMDHDGFMLGQPVHQLPALPTKNGRHWVNPSQERNDRLAAIVKAANGAWVPVTIDGFTDKQHVQLGYGIRYGKRTSFPRGQYDTAIRDNTLYIRHTAKEITS